MHVIATLVVAVLATAGPGAWSESFAHEFMLECQARLPPQALPLCGCLLGKLDGRMPEADARAAPETAAYHAGIADAMAACTEALPEPYRTGIEQGVEMHRQAAAELQLHRSSVEGDASTSAAAGER